MTVKKYLRGCTDKEIIELWNELCQNTNYTDGMCYFMQEFEDIVAPDDTLFREVYNKLDKNFSFGHQVFWWNGYGYICSGSYADFVEKVVDLDALEDGIEEDIDAFNICLDDY